MSESKECVFCRIVAGELPCFRLLEDELTLAFMDINPAHPGHALVIPKRHARDIYELGEADLAATALSARRVARAVRDALRPEGLNLVQSNGAAAAQSVMHFHMHVLPRVSGDALLLNWALQPGDPDEIGALAERIRARLPAR